MVQKPMRIACAAALAGAVVFAGAARAEMRLGGDRSALTLAASDASVEEVLKGLGDKFALRYRADIPLERRLNGNYSGSLHRLLADVLTGYDYIVVWSNAEQTEVIVLGAAGSTPTAAALARTARRAD